MWWIRDGDHENPGTGARKKENDERVVLETGEGRGVEVRIRWARATFKRARAPDDWAARAPASPLDGLAKSCSA
jgi:hypothetical protein